MSDTQNFFEEDRTIVIRPHFSEKYADIKFSVTVVDGPTQKPVATLCHPMPPEEFFRVLPIMMRAYHCGRAYAPRKEKSCPDTTA